MKIKKKGYRFVQIQKNSKQTRKIMSKIKTHKLKKRSCVTFTTSLKDLLVLSFEILSD